MKRNSLNLYTILGFSILLFMISSCATKVPFMVSSVVPAAEGKVTLKKDNNKNYSINVDVINLADPSRLQPSKSTYVVWMESNRNDIKNIGQINSSSKFLSNKLKGSFSTVSVTKPTKVFITAENDGKIEYPGDMVVLTTRNF
ncbi:MAG: hypothetical protein ACM3VS_12665 [Candidatus Dadabacteria bacterium]